MSNERRGTVAFTHARVDRTTPDVSSRCGTLGRAGAAGLVRLMSSVLFGISPLDPVTFAPVPLLLGGAAGLASYLPARRAAAIDPVQALKVE